MTATRVTVDEAAIIARSTEGDDAPRARRWSTTKAAIAHWCAHQDEGARLKSTSDPSRFDAVPSSRRRLFTGLEDVEDVGLAWRRAIALARDRVQLSTSPEIVEDAVTAAAVGVRVTRRIVGRKGTVDERRPATEEELVAIAQRAGIGHVGVLKAITRAAIRDCRAELERKGLVPVMREPSATSATEDKRMASQAMIDAGYDLEGVKEICAYLGCGETRLRSLRAAGLPLHEVDGRVFGARAALALWLRARVRHADDRPAAKVPTHDMMFDVDNDEVIAWQEAEAARKSEVNEG